LIMPCFFLLLMPVIYRLVKYQDALLLQSMEGSSYDRAASLLLAVCIFLIVLSFIRFHLSFHDFLAYLKALARLPGAAAFFQGLLNRPAMVDRFWIFDMLSRGHRKETAEAAKATDSVDVAGGTGQAADGEAATWMATLSFIHEVLVAFLVMLLFQLTGLLLLFYAILSYPFEPSRFLTFYVGLLILVFSLSILWVVIRMSRNSVLSWTIHSRAHKLDWDRGMITGLLVFVVFPIGNLFVTLFPSISGTLMGWLEPLLKSFM